MLDSAFFSIIFRQRFLFCFGWTIFGSRCDGDCCFPFCQLLFVLLIVIPFKLPIEAFLHVMFFNERGT